MPRPASSLSRATPVPASGRSTFVIGGGPGTSSAYLNLGALGPWRIAFEGAASTLRPLTANDESWLAFHRSGVRRSARNRAGTTGSQHDAKAKERVWSVDGDVDLLSDAIASWLRKHDRSGAPKVAGRAELWRLARAAHRRRPASPARDRAERLILVSPILDYGWRYHARSSPLSFLTLLPSFAAARMESEGAFDPHKLIAVQDYASTAFVDDYLKGLRDSEALRRLIDRVTEITGLAARGGGGGAGTGRRKAVRPRDLRARTARSRRSTIRQLRGDDPDPSMPRPDYADPFLAAMKAPLTAAMAISCAANGKPPSHPLRRRRTTIVFQNWRWNADHGMPESVTAMRKMLALDNAACASWWRMAIRICDAVFRKQR